MSNVLITRYTAGDENAWNDFLLRAKNSTFLFNRAYMDYHSARFKDHSILIYQRSKLTAIFPANEEDDVIYSHAGLSYGGLVLLPEVRLEDVLTFFSHLTRYFNGSAFKYIRYKCFPSYLCSHPSNEDQFVLYLLEAKLLRRDASCVLIRDKALPYQHGRKSSMKMANEKTLTITVDQDPTAFWDQVLLPNLKERFGAKPVHTADEMRQLISRFPENIRLYVIGEKGHMLAGVVLYVFPGGIHTQYISATQKGRDLGALDVLIDHIIVNELRERSYFSFGTSGDGAGHLNLGLFNWKEGFGGRIHVIDHYEIDTSRHTLLERYE